MSDRVVPLKESLIFDVGMHLGEDTNYYLLRGYKVVAFEANPELVKQNKKTFAKQIESGNLIIVEGAIVEDASQKRIKFYVNDDSSVWSTINPSFAERNEKLGTKNRIIEVNVVDFSACLEKYGVPYFMKIDIEGADLFCLKALRYFSTKPSYLSMESDKLGFDTLLTEITEIERLGYDSFKAVQQANVPKMQIPLDSTEGEPIDFVFSKEASGMFGSDLSGDWMNKDDVIARYRQIFTQYRLLGDDTFWQKNGIAQKILKGIARITGRHYPGWYDTHARHKSVTSVLP